MSARANLLPAVFVQRRCKRRRRRAWVTLWIALVAAQGVTALTVRERTRDVRGYRAQAVKLNALLKQEKATRDSLRAKADLIARDTALAKRLQEKHYWSRWLGSLSLMVPQRVMLTAVETGPPQFDAAQSVGLAVSPGAKQRSTGDGIRLFRLRGSAAQHEDLMALLKALNGVKWFRSVRLEEAKRQKVANREAIGFALACDW
jgi:Tfp pilus assembly protein PilN